MKLRSSYIVKTKASKLMDINIIVAVVVAARCSTPFANEEQARETRGICKQPFTEQETYQYLTG